MTALETSNSAVEFLIRFARVCHEAGYPADLQDRVLALARNARLEECPGLRDADARRGLARVAAAPAHLHGSRASRRSTSTRSPALTISSRTCSRGALIRTPALTALADIESRPLERPWPLLLAAYALAGAALTPVLGGAGARSPPAVVGLLVGAIALAATRAPHAPSRWRLRLRRSPRASARRRSSHLGLDASPTVVTFAALVTFLPGMRLTIGMRELSSEHLQSGVANIASALVQLLGLVFGVGVGRVDRDELVRPVGLGRHPAAFAPVDLIAAVAAGLAFTLTLRAQFRDAWMMCTATVLSLAANAAGAASSELKPASSSRRSRSASPAAGRTRASPLTARLHRARRAHARPGQRGLRQRPPVARQPDDQRYHGCLRHVRHRNRHRVRPHGLGCDPPGRLQPAGSREESAELRWRMVRQRGGELEHRATARVVAARGGSFCSSARVSRWSRSPASCSEHAEAATEAL